MVIYPQNPEQWKILATILQERAGVAPSSDLKLLGWSQDGRVCITVGLNGFIGSVCHMHVAYAAGFYFTPRAMLRAVFGAIFDSLRIKKVLGTVNSLNVRAMRFDRHLGFVEEHRLPGLHDDGGDIVLFSMTREQCRYLEPVATEAAHGR